MLKSANENQMPPDAVSGRYQPPTVPQPPVNAKKVSNAEQNAVVQPKFTPIADTAESENQLAAQRRAHRFPIADPPVDDQADCNKSFKHLPSASSLIAELEAINNKETRPLPVALSSETSEHQISTPDALTVDLSKRLAITPYVPRDEVRLRSEAAKMQSFAAKDSEVPMSVSAASSSFAVGAAQAAASTTPEALLKRLEVAAVTENPKPEYAGNHATEQPPNITVDKDKSGRIFSVALNEDDKEFVFRFDSVGNLSSLEKRKDSIVELTNFGPHGKPISKSLYAAGFAQITTFTEQGLPRTQQTTTPEFQENLLYGTTGEVTSKVRQGKHGYEIYTVRADGTSLKKRDDQQTYVRVENRPDGTSLTTMVDKVRRLTTRCVYNPQTGTTEVRESTHRVVETSRDVYGNLISQVVIEKETGNRISMEP